MAKKKKCQAAGSRAQPTNKGKAKPFNQSLGQAIKGWKQEPGASSPQSPREVHCQPPPAQVPQANDNDLWSQATSGIAPIQGRDRAVTTKPQALVNEGYVSDEKDVVSHLHALVDGNVPFCIEDRDDYQVGFIQGMDPGAINALRQGDVSWTTHIDLHGLTKKEAKQRFTRFVIESRRSGHCCVLVVTGRGLGSPDGVSILRESLPRWASRGPAGKVTLAFCTALPRDGGPGAFYLLLRKSGSRPYIPLMKEEE